MARLYGMIQFEGMPGELGLSSELYVKTGTGARTSTGGALHCRSRLPVELSHVSARPFALEPPTAGTKGATCCRTACNCALCAATPGSDGTGTALPGAELPFPGALQPAPPPQLHPQPACVPGE